MIERNGQLVGDHLPGFLDEPRLRWDNAVAASFFGTLERELVHRESYADRDDARRPLFEYIEVFYNRRRRHLTLGYRSPLEFEPRFA